MRGAVEQGADWVEIDVHPSADGALVICHDAAYADGRDIWDTPSAERPNGVGLLEEILDAARPLGVNIEIKVARRDTDVVRDVVAVLAGRTAQPILVSSFDEATLDLVRAADAGVETAQLVFDLATDPELPERAARAGARDLNPWDPLVDEALVERCEALGLGVVPWTVDDPQRIAELAGLGVHGIITNRPAATRRVLEGP